MWLLFGPIFISILFYLFCGLLALHWLSSCSWISNCEYWSFLLIFVFLIFLSQSIYFFVIYLTVSVTLIVYFVDLWFAFPCMMYIGYCCEEHFNSLVLGSPDFSHKKMVRFIEILFAIPILDIEVPPHPLLFWIMLMDQFVVEK